MQPPTIILRASTWRLGFSCTRRQSVWLTRARCLLSTTAIQDPLTLSSDLTDSPIHVSSPLSPTSSLARSSPAPFLFYPAFLSCDEQAVLLHTCLSKLDASLSQSRDIRQKRKEWRRERNGIPYYGFLPDELYDFEEVMSLSPTERACSSYSSHSYFRVTTTGLYVDIAKCISLRGLPTTRHAC
jgi:hypothetical protein